MAVRPSLLVLAALAPALAAQQHPPTAQQFAMDQLQAKLDDSGRAWLPFLERRSLSCGVYRLPAGATDGQSPHDRDEVYYVVSGRARLEVGGETLDASAGAVLFVAARAPHRFVDIEEDLCTLVFFSNSLPTTGGMAEGPRPTKQTPYHEGSERGSARIFYWFGDSSAGQVNVDSGRPPWKPAYDELLSTPGGQRWRCGENFWTSLDTNVALTLGGVALAPGQYCLVLENHAEHGLRLIALDPAEVRARRLDAYEAGETTGGIAIPLQREQGGMAPRLDVRLRVDREREHHGVLEVAFGPHRLRAELVLKP